MLTHLIHIEGVRGAAVVCLGCSDPAFLVDVPKHPEVYAAMKQVLFLYRRIGRESGAVVGMQQAQVYE